MSSQTNGLVLIRLLHLLKSATASHPDANDVAESQNENIIKHHITTNDIDCCHKAPPNIDIASMPNSELMSELNKAVNMVKMVAKMGHHSIEPNIPKSM